MKLNKLTIPELYEILSAQTRILAEYRDQLKPEQKRAISQIIDEIVREVNSRKEKDENTPS